MADSINDSSVILLSVFLFYLD